MRKGERLAFGQQLLLIFQLSIPAIMAQISSIVMQYIDASMVGQLGAKDSASIGLVSSSTWLMGGLCSAASIGFTVQIAQRIGAEEEKGNALVKETMPLLKACGDIHFIGSVEARDIPYGAADVLVCEAFVGNVILKMYEGTSSMLLREVKRTLMSSTRTKMGALLIKPALKKTLKSFDASQYGGAPMLGLKGLVVKMHGSSKAVEVKNSIIQCMDFSRQDLNEKISRQFMAGTAE